MILVLSLLMISLGLSEARAEPKKLSLHTLFPSLGTSVTSSFKSSNALLDDPDYKYLHSSCNTYSNNSACNGKVAFGVVPTGNTGVPDAHVALNRMTVVTPNGSRTFIDVEIKNGQLTLDPSRIPKNGIGIIRLGYFYGSASTPLSACSMKIYQCGSDVKACPRDDTAPTCFPLLGRSSQAGCIAPTGTTCEDLKPNICSGVTFYDGCGASCGQIGTKTCTSPTCTARITTHAIGNPTTAGTSDGFIVLSASGGSGTFTFALDPVVGTSSPSGNLGTFSGLSGASSPGKKYTVKASDATDPTCSTSVDYLLTEPVPCTLAFTVTKKDPSTEYRSNGQIVATYSGANGPVSYSLTPAMGIATQGRDSVAFDGLSAPQEGTTYRVILQDKVCSKTQDVTLQAPPGGAFCKIAGQDSNYPNIYEDCSKCEYGSKAMTANKVACNGQYLPPGGGRDGSYSYRAVISRCNYSNGETAPIDCGVNHPPDKAWCADCTPF